MRIYRSQHDDIELPQLDVLTLLFESEYCAAKEDTRIHIEAANPDNFVTKAEARDLVRRVAHILRNRFGIGSSRSGQDVVLSVASGSPLIPLLFYSIVATGGVYSGASTAFTANELAKQIKDADAKLLLCSAECEEVTKDAAKQCGMPLDRILIIDPSRPKDWRLISAADRSNVLDYRGPMLDWRRTTTQKELENTTVCLLYSSGTTGLPKGVNISQWNLVACCLCSAQLGRKFIDQSKRDSQPFHFSTIAHLPMAHIGGISWSSLIPLFVGGTAYWIDKYDFPSFIEYHRRYSLTVQWTVPPIWLAIANSPDVTDHFDSLQLACTGAAPMGPELTKKATQRLGRGNVKTISQLWGATETTGSMTGIDWHESDETCSHGRPFPNTRLRLVDENGADVEEGQPGEILVSGPLICQGYHNRPEANRASFTNSFYHTGDVGVWQNGLLYVVDRLKELIKYKGLQVAPAEVEAHLLSHPKISDAAVIGVMDEVRATEVPRAFVVVREGEEVGEEEVVEWVRGGLANHKQLRGGVVFVGEIPKSASGKILRKELRLYGTSKAKL